jgi:transposase, IS5 family
MPSGFGRGLWAVHRNSFDDLHEDALRARSNQHGGTAHTNGRAAALLDGDVPNAEKIYSIFELHTELTSAGRCSRQLSSATRYSSPKHQGLITQYEVLKRNPLDEVRVAPWFKRHRRAFRRPPELYGADRASSASRT